MLGPLSILRISKCQNEGKGKACVILIDEFRDYQNKTKNLNYFQSKHD